MSRRPNDRFVTACLITENARLIQRNGCLIQRKEAGRKPTWCIRFRVKCPNTGQKKHRNISLGADPDPELFAKVTQIITNGRESRASRRAELDGVRLRRREQQEVEGLILTTLRGSRRYRRRVKKEYRDYMENESHPNMLLFCFQMANGRVRRPRRGRPVKNRLW